MKIYYLFLIHKVGEIFKTRALIRPEFHIFAPKKRKKQKLTWTVSLNLIRILLSLCCILKTAMQKNYNMLTKNYFGIQ